MAVTFPSGFAIAEAEDPNAGLIGFFNASPFDPLDVDLAAVGDAKGKLDVPKTEDFVPMTVFDESFLLSDDSLLSVAGAPKNNRSFEVSVGGSAVLVVAALVAVAPNEKPDLVIAPAGGAPNETPVFLAFVGSVVE